MGDLPGLDPLLPRQQAERHVNAVTEVGREVEGLEHPHLAETGHAREGRSVLDVLEDRSPFVLGAMETLPGLLSVRVFSSNRATPSKTESGGVVPGGSPLPTLQVQRGCMGNILLHRCGDIAWSTGRNRVRRSTSQDRRSFVPQQKGKLAARCEPTVLHVSYPTRNADKNTRVMRQLSLSPPPPPSLHVCLQQDRTLH